MELTITRALKELKLLEQRISKAINTVQAVDVQQNKRKGFAIGSNKTVDEFNQAAMADYQSLVALMDRRLQLKKGIVEANALTKVKINGREMTIAAALDFKHFINFKKSLLQRLKAQHADIIRRIENHRATLEDQVNKLVLENTGKDRKADREDFDKIATPFMEANDVHLIDPLKLEEKIHALEEEIDGFEAEVDIVLSEANAKTVINL